MLNSAIASSLPILACLALAPPIELVDFIFFSERTLGSFMMLFDVADNSLTSLRVRRFRSSRAIFSNVVPRFLGVGDGRWGASTSGNAGRGLLVGGT